MAVKDVVLEHETLRDRSDPSKPRRHVATSAEARVLTSGNRGWRRVSSTQVAAPAAPEVPDARASKADWVDYARVRGVSLADAEAATKADLVERFS